jgi:hypothetical protein
MVWLHTEHRFWRQKRAHRWYHTVIATGPRLRPTTARPLGPEAIPNPPQFWRPTETVHLRDLGYTRRDKSILRSQVKSLEPGLTHLRKHDPAVAASQRQDRRRCRCRASELTFMLAIQSPFQVLGNYPT